jgi:hypothetical protein
MDNQHRYISGYRELTREEINYVNELKKAERLLLGRLEEMQIDCPEIDGRWLAIGITQLEQGFMATLRSITRPDTRAGVAIGDNSDSAA